MDNVRKPKVVPPCPRENANILSYMSFWWVLPVLFKGAKKTLDIEDLYQPLYSHKSDNIGNKLCKAWEDEIQRYVEKDQKPSLLRATLKVFGWQIMGLGIILLAKEVLLQITQPLFLGGLIAYYSNSQNKDEKSRESAYYYAGAVIICSALNVIVSHPLVLSTLHSGMQLRVALCSMIYRKALRLSKNALGDTTSGQIVNLLSNDVGRLDISVIFLHYLWVGPVETIIVTYLMYREIGIAAIFGVIFLLMFIPMQGWLGKKTSSLRFRTAQRTDERVRLMNEIIQGIQVIKMYAWEKPFSKLIELARKKEVRVIRYVSYIRGILLSFILFTTRVSVFISLVAYFLLGNEVTAKKAFVITAFYNILRQTMTVFFPQGIGQLAETLVSFKRIQTYMLYDEIPSDSKLSNTEEIHNGEDETLTMPEKSAYSTESTLTKSIEQDTITKSSPLDFESNISYSSHLSEPGLVLTNIKAKWISDATEYTLDDVNLRVQPETLVAIIGPVGAGKSSLMQSILGELQIESGEMKINGSISYASQESWLFSSSIRQNILFGQPFEKDRYRKVVKKCALERDFTLFPDGDQTIVGERGTSLSGGQKARISLARACYRRASIYLLDDPLSAVDAHVGKHLFDQCMKEYLKDKIVILVTHQLQYLQSADQIVILEHGKIKAVGTYDSLRESGLDFAKLLSDGHAKDEEGENSDFNLSRTNSQTCENFNRKYSQTSLNSMDDKKVEEIELRNEEKTETGEIGWNVYKAYIKAGGGLCTFFMVVIFFGVAQSLASGGDYFVTYWVNKVEKGKLETIATVTPTLPISETTFSTNPMDILDSFDVVNNSVYDAAKYIQEQIPIEESVNVNEVWGNFTTFWDNLKNDKNFDIYVFSIITIATVLVTIGRSFHFFNFAMRASKNLHNSMFNGLIRASMHFFHTNPSGRILNRFSKDLGQVDEILPAVGIDVFQIFLALFGILIVIAIVNVYLFLPILLISIIFYYMRDFYLKSSRNLKRMEATTRSPIYNHLSASLNGLSTIRAFNAQKILVREFDNHQDLNSSAFYLAISASRAFGYWLDVWCLFYITIVTLSFFLIDESYGGNVGLAITQVMGMTGMVQWGMRQSAELENNMTSVERLVEYQNIETEGKLESEPDKKPPKDWPDSGKIKFDKVSLRYAPDPESENVLKDLEFEIRPCEKIGIVGRTGAGKSSLINALFRLSYNTGSIIIDMRDTNSMGLHDLRSKISIIPQEPVLFSGTMRYNLDPFEEYTDDKLWSALEQVKLKEVVTDLPAALETRIAEGGSNFSVGQRQLVCLARAILRENKILLMDEATANVDPQTDALIQTTIRNKFLDCTVLTIAHRLNTVMDSDKILVMDAGHAVEFGTPYELLTRDSGPKLLRSMAKQMGKGTFDSFVRVAETAQKNYKVE